MPRLFVDNLTVLDCSILDPKRGLIGASWAVDIELFGELDYQSMVFDFAKVKKTIKQVIDSVADHKLIIPLDYQNIEVTGEQELIVRFTDRKGSLIEHISPAAAVCLIPAERVSRKRLGAFLNQKIIQALPENVEKLDIKLRKEYGLGKFYTYSHTATASASLTGIVQRSVFGKMIAVIVNLNAPWPKNGPTSTWGQRKT